VVRQAQVLRGCRRTLAPALGGVCGIIVFGLAACTTHPAAPAGPTLLSPVAEVTENPWREAQRRSASVPDSTLMVGDGTSMLPLYPNGTVLVLQTVEWAHLQPGMTVVYSMEPDAPFDMVAHVLKAKHGQSWEAQGVNNDQPDEVAVTRDNYVGTVVAAFCAVEPAR
jgi:hypothetical protein